MRINVLYFASLREAVGMSSEELTLTDHAPTVATLHQLLIARGGSWAAALDNNTSIKFAVNQQFAAADTPLTDNCEVAIFPPITGG